jgi:hypothetical protein
MAHAAPVLNEPVADDLVMSEVRGDAIAGHLASMDTGIRAGGAERCRRRGREAIITFIAMRVPRSIYTDQLGATPPTMFAETCQPFPHSPSN